MTKHNRKPRRPSQAASSSTSVTRPVKAAGSESATPTVIYYDNIIGDPRLLATYQDVLHKLLRGDALREMSFRLKQMSGYRIYTISLDRASRLLFGEMIINRQKLLVLLDLVDNHKYQHSILNNKKLIRQFFINHEESIAEAAASSSGDQTDEFEWSDVKQLVQTDLPWMIKTTAVSLKYFNGELFWLGDVDQQALGFAELPMLLTGPAGAGKTSDGFFIMERALGMRHPEDPDQPRYNEVVYLAKNPKLVAEHRRVFESAVAPVENGPMVRFETCEAWVKRNKPELAQLQWVGDEAFFSWYETFKQTRRRLDKTKTGAKPARSKAKSRDSGAPYGLTPQVVRQEVRTASGYTKEQYSTPGKFWTSLPTSGSGTSAPHVYIYDVLEAWQTHLLEHTMFDPATTPFVCEVRNDVLLVIDEAPDLSWGELRDLLQAVDMNAVFCAGPLQNLDNDVSCIPYLKGLPAMLTHGERTMCHLDLPHTHRVPPALLPLANLATALAHHFGGASYSGQFANLCAAPSQVSRLGDAWWLEKPSEACWQQLNEAASSPNCLVITHEAFLKEAEARFAQGTTILLPEQAKGLQAELVILYRYLEIPALAGLSRNIPADFQPGDNERTTINRPHIEKRVTRFNKDVNTLFSSITRAQGKLIWVTPEAPTAPVLSALIKARCTQRVLDSQALDSPLAATEEDWMARITQLINAGLEARAQALYQHRFADSGRPFTQLLADRPESQPQAPVVASCSVAASSVAVDNQEKAIQILREKFANKRGIQQVDSRVAQVKNATPWRHWLTTPFDLMPYLSVEQLFQPITGGSDINNATSLFGVLCDNGERSFRLLLLDVLKANPAITRALASQLRELAANPDDSPFIRERSELHMLYFLGATKEGRPVLTFLANASGLDINGVLGAVLSHLPTRVHQAATPGCVQHDDHGRRHAELLVAS